MAKPRKQKQGGGSAAEAAADAGGDAARRQNLCVAIDMERESIIGHTELPIVFKNGVAELHSGGLEISRVFVDGNPAKFQKKEKTPNSSQQASPRAQSSQEAAATAYYKYKAALEAEVSPDLSISLPPSSPSQNNESSQDTSKPSTEQNVKLIQIHFSLGKPKSKIFFSGNLFQTHRVYHWFPCLGSMSSRCSYHLEFSVKVNYVAVSAGKLMYQVLNKDGNMKTYVYELDVPTPASFITLVATPLEIIPERQNANISHMCPPGCVLKLQSSVNCYYSLFSLYEDYLGSAFPFGCYKQVFVESEHSVASTSIGASMVVLSSNLLVDERVIDQAIITQIKLSQALAQQWFGVFITPETDRDVWLLEGISGFLVHLFIRKFLGNNEAQFRKFKAIGAVTEADVESFPPLCPSSVPAGAFRAEKLGLLGKVRLWKAVAVIQMLEKQMGPESLRKVLQRIVSRAGERNMRTLSTKEFRHFANKIGNLERPFLKEFFPRWVESQGCPLLRMGFEYNKRRNLVEFAVHRDCTAPEVMIPGNKPIADVGWPGMMNIQIHELDGMYDHPNLSLSGDVHQLLEIPCHSKMANRRPQRPKKPGKVEIIDDLADDKPSVESPLLWLRADPGMDYLAKIQLWQPEQMWINQLERDKDAVAQLQAISALQKLPVSFFIVNALNGCLIDSKVFCRVRVEAAFALANTAGEGTSWSGLQHLMKYYKSRCFDMEIGLPRSNSFHDFSEYFVLQAVPPAVGTVRGGQGKSPPEAVEFILNILKHNDNSGNAYSDSFWLSSIIESVGELEISQQSMPKFAKILKQIDRYLQYDRLMPSYNCILTRSCIRTLTRLALKFNTLISLEPVEKLLSQFRIQTTQWQVRVAALQAQMDIKFQSDSLNATLLLAIKFASEDPCPRVQTKVMSYALSICLRKHAATSSVDPSTASRLVDMFGSERCAMNCKLRHHVFTILQVLAGKPATLLRVSKLPPKGPLLSPSGKKEDADISKVKVRVIQTTKKEPEPLKTGKLTLRLKSSASIKLPALSATPEAVNNGKVVTPDQSLVAKPATSTSSQVASGIGNSGVEKMEVDENLASSNFQDLIEVIDINPVPANAEPESQVVTVLEQAETSRKEEKKKDKERKEKKDKKEKKEKKDKKHKKDKKEKKEKKEKRDREKHKQDQPSPAVNTAVPQANESASGNEVRQPSIFMKVKQEISETMAAPLVQATPPAPPIAVKRPGEGGFKLKIKRPKVE